MLRKTTDLEKKLLNKGFKLVFKTYKDTKSSKRIESYAYKGEVNNYECFIYLNSKRTEVINFIIANKNNSNLISEGDLFELEMTFHKLEDIFNEETSTLAEEEVENNTYES